MHGDAELGCPYSNHRHDLRIRSVPAEPEALSLAFFQSTGVALEPGHRVEMVNNGRVLEVIEESSSRGSLAATCD